MIGTISLTFLLYKDTFCKRKPFAWRAEKKRENIELYKNIRSEENDQI